MVHVYWCLHIIRNSPYPENTNFETCASGMLKFYTFGSLLTSKKCWKFELDIFSYSGVIDLQKIVRTYSKML